MAFHFRDQARRIFCGGVNPLPSATNRGPDGHARMTSPSNLPSQDSAHVVLLLLAPRPCASNGMHVGQNCSNGVNGSRVGGTSLGASARAYCTSRAAGTKSSASMKRSCGERRGEGVNEAHISGRHGTDSKCLALLFPFISNTQPTQPNPQPVLIPGTPIPSPGAATFSPPKQVQAEPPVTLL